MSRVEACRFDAYVLSSLSLQVDLKMRSYLFTLIRSKKIFIFFFYACHRIAGDVLDNDIFDVRDFR